MVIRIVQSESCYRTVCFVQGDHLSGKPGNVRDFVNSQGKKYCHGKVSPKVFITS